MKKTKQLPMTIINNTHLDYEYIKGLTIIGINKNNWMQRTIMLYQDLNPNYVIAVGITFDNTTTIISRELLEESRNFQTAIDYWSHGNKVYVRD